MKLQDINNEILLQIAILGLLEDDKMTVHQVSALVQKTVRDVWYGLRSEELEATQK